VVLTDLQRRIMQVLARNRSETSYIAGGLLLNRDWPRVSDDIDVFHDTDEEVGEAAAKDIATLREAGFRVSIEVEVYGVVEAVVSQSADATVIQWMSESRRRFFPLVRDEEWGARLAQADLAVNKVIAASTRSKARDHVDLVSIGEFMCPLGPLVLAAAGKPPFYSPKKTVEEIRRRGLGISDEEYATVRGIPKEWDARFIRARLLELLDQADAYADRAPVEAVGALSVDGSGTPIEVTDAEDPPGVSLRRATEEPEIMPAFKDSTLDWRR
jgi:hypothetical protein